MMTDYELLEAAAKAAGLKYEVFKNGAFYIPADSDFQREWNPLTDDGDALRLAVKALNWPTGGNAFRNAVTSLFAVGQLPKDPYTATRRAIVVAAATFGGHLCK